MYWLHHFKRSTTLRNQTNGKTNGEGEQTEWEERTMIPKEPNSLLGLVWNRAIPEDLWRSHLNCKTFSTCCHSVWEFCCESLLAASSTDSAKRESPRSPCLPSIHYYHSVEPCSLPWWCPVPLLQWPVRHNGRLWETRGLGFSTSQTP